MSVPGVPIADPQRAFLEHLPTIERVLGIIARRNSLSSTDADEFGSWVRTRIIDSDYAIFRKFAGRSTMPTYLTVVLGNLFHDYRNSVWGRWRSSAAALRMGGVAIRLEELLYRDGASLREAIEVLHSAGATETDAELRRMVAQLPVRLASSEVSLDALDGTMHEAHAPAQFDAESDDFAVLRDALEQLPAEDQLIMRMRFWNDLSVADIARALRLEQKPLYRRIEAIETRMRALLTRQGLDQDRARDILFSEVAW